MKKSDVKVTKEKMLNGGISLVIETKNARLSISFDKTDSDIILHSSDSCFDELWVSDKENYTVKKTSMGGFIRLEKVKEKLNL